MKRLFAAPSADFQVGQRMPPLNNRLHKKFKHESANHRNAMKICKTLGLVMQICPLEFLDPAIFANYSRADEQHETLTKNKRSLMRKSKQRLEGQDNNAADNKEEHVSDINVQFTLPAWLKTTGPLRLSPQTATLLPTMTDEQRQKVRKKYRDCYCAICAEFQPDSPWSQVRGRKYEKELRHERSFYHQKALTFQADKDSLV